MEHCRCGFMIEEYLHPSRVCLAVVPHIHCSVNLNVFLSFLKHTQHFCFATFSCSAFFCERDGEYQKPLWAGTGPLDRQTFLRKYYTSYVSEDSRMASTYLNMTFSSYFSLCTFIHTYLLFKQKLNCSVVYLSVNISVGKQLPCMSL